MTITFLSYENKTIWYVSPWHSHMLRSAATYFFSLLQAISFYCCMLRMVFLLWLWSRNSNSIPPTFGPVVLMNATLRWVPLVSVPDSLGQHGKKGGHEYITVPWPQLLYVSKKRAQLINLMPVIYSAAVPLKCPGKTHWLVSQQITTSPSRIFRFVLYRYVDALCKASILEGHHIWAS